MLHTFTNRPAPAAPAPVAGSGGGRDGIPKVSPLWQTKPEPFSAAAGVHRVVWSPVLDAQAAAAAAAAAMGDDEAPPPAALTGTFTARLTVDGRSYTQTLVVKPDPRGSPR